MLSITDQQGNANQNNKIQLHTCQNDENQQHKKQQVLKRMWRKGNSLALLQTGAATLENSMEIPQKVKNRTALQPSNFTTRYIPEDTKIQSQRCTCTPMFIAALSIIAKLWKQPKCPLTNEWIKKM